MRRQRKNSVSVRNRLLLLCSLGGTSIAFSFSTSTSQSRRNARQRLCSTSARIPDPSSEEVDEAESNFWRTVVRRDDGPTSEKSRPRIPCDPSLDDKGPLPPGAYQILGDTKNDPRPTCLLTMAVDTGRSDEDDNIISRMQQFIDCGFTTFLVDETSQEVYDRLRKDTPPSVLRRCNFVVPFVTPSTSVLAHPSFVRDTVLQSLRRSGGDCIDTVQVEYTNGSPYHLDVLDYLTELQREGYIRSMSGKSMPTALLREAASCGFEIGANEISCNLFDPTQYTRDLRLVCEDLGTQLTISKPLASGMLTDKYLHTQWEPQPLDFTGSERSVMEQVVTPWAKKHSSSEDVWGVYQVEMMDTLGDIALKYRVSVSSVVLRWALQLDHVASVVVATVLPDIMDDRPFDRPEQLRQVFRFELDQDDMDRLWEASGEIELIREPEINPVDFEDMDFGEMEDGDTNTLFLPDASNRKLWL